MRVYINETKWNMVAFVLLVFGSLVSLLAFSDAVRGKSGWFVAAGIAFACWSVACWMFRYLLAARSHNVLCDLLEEARVKPDDKS